jgi:hypothetical protein
LITHRTALIFLQGIIVADMGNDRLVLVAQNGSITLLAGNGAGDATSSGVVAPQRMATTPTGGIVVTTANCVMLLKDGNLSTLAGRSAAGAVDGLGNIATFEGPSSIGVVNSSYLMVGDTGNKFIRGMTFNASLNKWLVTTVSSVSNKIEGVAYLSNFLYFIMETSNQVSRLSLATGVMASYCGQDGEGTLEGACTSAKFQKLQDLAVDANDNLVVLSKLSVRVINTTTLVTRFVAGGTNNGLVDGLGTTAKFNDATAITVDLLTGAAQLMLILLVPRS